MDLNAIQQLVDQRVEETVSGNMRLGRTSSPRFARTDQ